MNNEKLVDELIWMTNFEPKTPHERHRAGKTLRLAIESLRDEWIPIKEFLEDPVKGPCWETNEKEIYHVYYDGLFFHGGYFPLTEITHVIPINKPGLPK